MTKNTRKSTSIVLLATAAILAIGAMLRPSAPVDEIAVYRAQLHQSNIALKAALADSNAELTKADAVLAEARSTLDNDPTVRLF